jgi:G3E family GTPase
MDDRLALTIVTGFLGSGKTTLLQRFLRSAAGQYTAVLVNEFGEVALDHRLLLHAEERLDHLDGGCMCCARRADIARSIHELVRRAKAGRGEPLRHLVIETTGLADPAPIIATIGRDPWMSANVRLNSVIAVVDAVTGIGTIARHVEARRQVAIADTLIVTKTDLKDARPLEKLGAALRAIAPDARIFDSQAPDVDIGMIFAAAEELRLSLPARPIPEEASHMAGWESFLLAMPERVDWPAFTLWLSALLHAHGDAVLRVKGMLRISSTLGPVVIHGVQHIMHPPHHLPVGTALDRPFLIFITNGLSKATIEASLARFLARTSGFRPRATADGPTTATTS